MAFAYWLLAQNSPLLFYSWNQHIWNWNCAYMVLLNFVVCFVHFLYILCLFVILIFIGVFSFLFLLFMVIFEGSNLLNCYFLTWFKAEVERLTGLHSWRLKLDCIAWSVGPWLRLRLNWIWSRCCKEAGVCYFTFFGFFLDFLGFSGIHFLVLFCVKLFDLFCDGLHVA